MNIKSKMIDKTEHDIENITGGKLTLGKLLWSIRKCDEKSQIEFSNILGISKQHLCDLEHDRKNVSPKLAAHYAKTLGYPKEQFIQLALQNMVDRDDLGVCIEVASIQYTHTYPQHATSQRELMCQEPTHEYTNHKEE